MRLAKYCKTSRGGRASVRAASFVNADEAAENEQANGRDGCGEGKDEPHGFGMPLALFGAVFCQENAGASHEKFSKKERHVGKRAVGGLLAFGGDRGCVFIDARGVKGFADG